MSVAKDLKVYTGLKVCTHREILHCVQNDADNFTFQFSVRL